jgi:hypothetical protein
MPQRILKHLTSLTRSLRPHTEGSDTYLLIGGEGHKVGQDH